LLRVPYGDYNCLVLPEDAQEKENDYVMLSDIFPTGYHATELAGMKPGDSVVVYGAGPVGLMAATSAFVKGASRVFVVDTHKDRLKLARKIGAVAIDDTEGNGVEQIKELTKGQGADCGCECVGYQCCNMHGKEVPNLTMNNLVQAVKPTGGIGVVGVFLPQDPGAQDELAKEGKLAFDFGQLWFKGQRIGTGQANVKSYNRRLMNLIEAGKAKPSMIVSHELGLDQAPEAYEKFDKRARGWTKVILKPGKQAGQHRHAKRHPRRWRCLRQPPAALQASSLSSASAATSDDAGFWPVTSKPSVTAYGCQSPAFE
jgi:glutathione-independent formaldehyde dehydrogenase